jgi:hypothetical protein
MRSLRALAWTEALTRMAPTGVSDELYAEAREQFSDRELSTLTFRVMGINAWNRANVASPLRRGLLLGPDAGARQNKLARPGADVQRLPSLAGRRTHSRFGVA